MRPTRNPPKQPLDHEPAAVTYAREQAGLTKQQLADRCGVSRSLISEIELGTRNASPSMLNKLAEALNCPRVILERKRVPEATPPADDQLPAVRDAERPAGTDDLPELRDAAVERSA